MTTHTQLSKETGINPPKATNNPKKSTSHTELISALTPITIAIIGGIIGVSAILSPHIIENKLTAAMGLAGTALAGASGLAQSNKSE